MQQKKLILPYSWKERCPLLQDRVFYVPDYYREHNKDLFPLFPLLFGNEHPVYIEYCSGNGEWIVNKALQCSDCNWIAVEKQFNRVCKIYSKLHRGDIKNLFIVSGEALTFSREYLPNSCIDGVYINFPDPWPKKRHAKHRIIQSVFSIELLRIVKSRGGVTLVTDDMTYLKQMKNEMQGWVLKKKNFFTYGSSHFARLALAKGRKIYYLYYERA